MNRGELFWRAVRYGVAVFAGYLFGLAAGGMAPDGPGFFVLAGLGALALWFVFRQGARSQTHAAADAAARSVATAVAAVRATQTVNIAGRDITDAVAADHDLWQDRDSIGTVDVRRQLGAPVGSADPIRFRSRPPSTVADVTGTER